MPSPAPADLLLSSLTVNESDRIGVPIGTLNALGADGLLLPATDLTYALVAGAGSDDNSRFRLVNGQLQAAEVFDRESREQLRVRIRVRDTAGRSTEKAFTITVNDLPDPVATTPPQSPALVLDASSVVLDLNTRFDDPLSTGLVATFQLAPVQLANNPAAILGSGQIRVLLYNQIGQGAPLTTSNLQAYLTAKRYNGSFLHRSVPGFVVQGGGFNLEQTPTGNQIVAVTTFPAVKNEFSADRPNLRGTIAMAKLGNDPNSATSQWFWSLADNRAILDPQNGGFTVFGRVLDATDLSTLDAMAAVPVVNASAALGGVFGELPLSNGNLRVDNLLQFSSITIDQRPELSYSLIANSAPDLLAATLEGSRLQLRPLANRTKEVSLTLRATNLVGETLDQILRVQLRRQTSTTATIHTFDDAPGTLVRPTLTGSLAAPLKEDERVSILAAGRPIGVASPTPDRLSWRFQPSETITPGADGGVDLQARVETLEGATAPSSPAWSLQLGTAPKLVAPGSALLRLADPRPLVIQPVSTGIWDDGFEAWNAGSTTAAGQAVAGTGEAIGIGGLRRYAVSLRNAATSQVTLELGDGNHAFFLHDSWSPQAADLPARSDWQGRATAPRWDQLATIRLGHCDAAGATSLVDLTSPDFITGSITVVGGNTRGSRNVIWGSAADDTVIAGAADTVICASAGRNTLQLGGGADRLQYVSGAGASDRVTGFNPASDRLELWGVTPGTLPTLTLQAVGRNTVFTWDTNRVTFSGLALPSPGSLPDWVVVM